MGNFALLILDFTEKEDTLTREQYWLDKLKPVYNVLSQAENSAGFKHSSDSIELMRQKALGRKHSEEVRKAMSENRMGDKGSFFGRFHSEETKAKMKIYQSKRVKHPVPGVKLTVIDIKTNKRTIYDSIRKAAIDLKTNHTTIRNYLKSKKLYQDRFIFEIFS